jgi:hypothetical protein
MTCTCPWLVVGEAGDQILVYAGIWHEEGETLQSLQTECPDIFQDIEQYVRAVVDRDGYRLRHSGYDEPQLRGGST